jgi:hypothetical protein
MLLGTGYGILQGAWSACKAVLQPIKYMTPFRIKKSIQRASNSSLAQKGALQT